MVIKQGENEVVCNFIGNDKGSIMYGYLQELLLWDENLKTKSPSINETRNLGMENIKRQLKRLLLFGWL